MAEALQIVADERALDREQRARLHTAFLDEWNTWTNWRGDTFDLPGSWKADIDQLLRAGLRIDDLIELVDVAMAVKAKDTWKYFCGCCWRRLKQDVDCAAEIVSRAALSEEKLVTIWTNSQIAEHVQSSETYAGGLLGDDSISSAYCPHRQWGGKATAAIQSARSNVQRR